MTKHKQEALGLVGDSRGALVVGNLRTADLKAQLAQVHATLELAEQQRVANLIALLQNSPHIPQATAHEIQDELFIIGGALTTEARTTLGIGDTP